MSWLTENIPFRRKRLISVLKTLAYFSISFIIIFLITFFIVRDIPPKVGVAPKYLLGFLIVFGLEMVVFLFYLIFRYWGRIYRTCSFENIGSKKGEFLRRITQAMKEKGLEELPAVKPFEPDLNLDDALRIWDMKLWRELGLHQMVGTDVLLGYDRKERHLRMGLRVEQRNEDLRFGYLYTGERIFPLRSATGIKILLLILGTPVLSLVLTLFVVIVFLGKPFFQTYGSELTLTIAIIVFTISLSPLIYYGYKKIRLARRTIKKIDSMANEIAESLGGRRITPYKMTTVKLEE